MGLLFRRVGTSCRADDYVSEVDCAALRAMTGLEGESAVMLFVVFTQLLKLCGAIRNLVCFPGALPLGCCIIVSQGVDIGLLFYRFPRRCNWARVCWAFSLLTMSEW